MSKLTTNDLIASVKRRALVPTSQIALTNSDIIKFANEEILNRIVPLIIKFGNEYLIVEETVEANEEGWFYVPHRALGGKIRDLKVEIGGFLYDIAQIERERRDQYQIATNYPRGFYTQGNKVLILPTNTARLGTYKIAYPNRPNDLVADNESRTIVSIDNTTKQITLNNNFNQFVYGAQVDITSKYEDCLIKAWDLNIEGFNPTTCVMQFAANVDLSELEEGDIVTLAGTSIVPQIPSELHPLIAERVVYRIYEALNNATGMQMAAKSIEDMEKNLQYLISQRVKSDAIKIINRNSMNRTNARIWNRTVR